MFIAYLNENPVGVAGLRRFRKTDAEVKRMVVRDEAKGKGVNKLLLEMYSNSEKFYPPRQKTNSCSVRGQGYFYCSLILSGLFHFIEFFRANFSLNLAISCTHQIIRY